MKELKFDCGALLILAALVAVPVGVGYEVLLRHAQPYPPAILLAVAVLCFCVRSLFDVSK